MTLKFLFIAALLALLAACGDNTPDQPAADVTASAPAAEMATPELAATTIARTPSPEGARVFFVSPADGATVSNPVKLVFGIEGMTIAPAGNDTPQSGHHHLLIDTGLPPLDQPIPKDAQHIHFGDGSTETEITLPPGDHTLCLLLGDARHIPHDPPVVSEMITIHVE